MNKTKLAVLCVTVLAAATSAVAQNPPRLPNTEVYRFDFALKETDGGKPVNTRNYQMMASAGHGLSSIRAGAKIPTSDGKGTQYIDVGVNLDLRQINATQDGLMLDISAEVSGTLDAGAQPRNPVVRQTRWSSLVEIPIGKPTTVFSSDDPSSKHQLQLEVTAMPIH